MMMKISLVGLFLLSVAGSAISAAPSTDAKPWPHGSREHRPVVKEPTPGSPTTGKVQLKNADPLVAAQLATIQGVGRNVLAAKHSVKPDPAVEVMREQLKAVSTDLAQVVRDSSLPKPVLQHAASHPPEAGSEAEVTVAITTAASSVRRVVPGSAPNTFVEETRAPSEPQPKPSAAKAASVASMPTENANAWHSQTASLQNRLNSARKQPSVVAGTPDVKATVHQRLAKKQTELFDEIQRAVGAHDTAQLAALRDRLTPRQLPAERERLRAMADPKHKIQSAAPTPTVSTLTKHR